MTSHVALLMTFQLFFGVNRMDVFLFTDYFLNVSLGFGFRFYISPVETHLLTINDIIFQVLCKDQCT